jgi:cell division protein FtsW
MVNCLIILFSFMPVLVRVVIYLFRHGTGNTLGYLVKHFIHICCGFAIIFQSTRFYNYFRSISKCYSFRRMDSITIS